MPRKNRLRRFPADSAANAHAPCAARKARCLKTKSLFSSVLAAKPARRKIEERGLGGLAAERPLRSPQITRRAFRAAGDLRGNGAAGRRRVLTAHWENVEYFSFSRYDRKNKYRLTGAERAFGAEIGGDALEKKHSFPSLHALLRRLHRTGRAGVCDGRTSRREKALCLSGRGSEAGAAVLARTAYGPLSREGKEFWMWKLRP